VSTAIVAGSVIAAPVTGGASLWGLTIGVPRMIGENSMKWRETKVNDMMGGYSDYFDSKVSWVEIHYCHIGTDLEDFGATLGARALGMTTMACHHWYIIVKVVGLDGYVYFDKHDERNILKREDTDGKNGGGDGWNSGTRLKHSRVKRWGGNVTLRELIEYVKRDEHKHYHLLDDNCQHFAKNVYRWLKGK